MAHRSLSTLVFAGFAPTTAATVISFMGDNGLPGDIRIQPSLAMEPWQTARSGLLVIGMDPTTDLVRVSELIQNRTTYWEVAVCLPEVLSYYSVALLAQGAAKVLTHPEDDLERTKKELRTLLRSLTDLQSDAFGLEVADLIQLYGEKRIARTIRINGEGTIGSIYLHNGQVAHAETMDDREGMEAFKKLIALSHPEMRVHKGCLTDRKTMGIPAMSALLEGSRIVDEETYAPPAPGLGPNESGFDFGLDEEEEEEFSSVDAVPRLPSSVDGLPKLDLGEDFEMPDLDNNTEKGGKEPKTKDREKSSFADPMANLFGSEDDLD